MSKPSSTASLKLRSNDFFMIALYQRPNSLASTSFYIPNYGMGENSKIYGLFLQVDGTCLKVKTSKYCCFVSTF